MRNSLIINPPRRHHYIPQFYLSRWVSEDGRLCEFSRPFNTIKPKRRHPAETGYIDRLYELEGLTGPMAQALESSFFQPIDSAAAAALQHMEAYGNRANWNDVFRSGWAQFLHSMLLRMPEDLTLFKTAWRELMISDKDDHWQKRYEALRKPTDPPTYQGYMAGLSPEQHNRSAVNALAHMMASVRIGQKISNMIWWIFETDPKDHPLLTSDRPVIRSNGLAAANGHLVVPIGPHRLFIAARDSNVLHSILSLGSRRIIRETNRQVTQHASKLVYGINDRHLEFVKKHFNIDPDPRLLESTVSKVDEIKLAMLEYDRKST